MSPDQAYLIELATILESPADTCIKIQTESARDIAERLREIAGRMTTNTIH